MFRKNSTEIQANKIPDLDSNSIKNFKKLSKFNYLIEQKWIKKLNHQKLSKVENDMRLLEFEDALKIFSLNGIEIGTFNITVSPLIHQRTNCFRVIAKR